MSSTLDLQCETCDERICHVCKDEDHNKHEITTYDEHMQHFEKIRQKARFDCDTYIENERKRITSMEEMKKQADDKVNAGYDKMIEFINEQRTRALTSNQ